MRRSRPGVCPASSQAGITDNIKGRNAFDFISAHQRPSDPNKAGIRIDLSGIGAQKP
ncbi:hypothetical protein [Sinorhizobium medicae]|uniref:hypothetical protein n=1 Tax=Sinorhizobium medicae TaxID=110321 RepID=UPI003C72D9B9